MDGCDAGSHTFIAAFDVCTWGNEKCPIFIVIKVRSPKVRMLATAFIVIKIGVFPLSNNTNVREIPFASTALPYNALFREKWGVRSQFVEAWTRRGSPSLSHSILFGAAPSPRV